MGLRCKFVTVFVALHLCTSISFAQQKPQWLAGQEGLNAGILPSPGFTYANLTANYNADTFIDRNGNAVLLPALITSGLLKISDCHPVGGNSPPTGLRMLYSTC